MDAFKISIKLYVEDAGEASHAQFVPIFHSWIQNHAVADHTLIDVADYAHVHNGAGVVLIAHEANFYLDTLDGFLGFTYSRKHPAAGTFADRLRQAVSAAIEGAQRLTQETNLKFRTNEIALKLNDRLLAPNTSETFEQIRGDVEQLASQLWPGGAIDIEHIPSAATLLEVRLRSDQSPYLPTMLRSITSASPAPSR
jgi:hypothetical protein